MTNRNKVNEVSWDFEFCSAVSFAEKLGRHKTASNEKYRLNPLSVTSIYFSFVLTNPFKRNGIDKRHGDKALTGKPTMCGVWI